MEAHYLTIPLPDDSIPLSQMEEFYGASEDFEDDVGEGSRVVIINIAEGDDIPW